MSEEQLRAALGAAKEALPRVGESESVYCSIRGYHLRALVAALAEPKAQAQAGGMREAPGLLEVARKVVEHVRGGRHLEREIAEMAEEAIKDCLDGRAPL